MTEQIVDEPFTTNYDNPHDFLSALRTSSEEWGTGWQPDWIFRGQRDSSWGLLPSSLREDGAALGWINKRLQRQHHDLLGFLQKNDGAFNERFRLEALQLAAEREVLLQFAKGADDAGLSMPVFKSSADSTSLIRSGSASIKHFSHMIRQDHEIFALAQHHGVPTRLLDWTETAWYAAFFAASDCFDHIRRCDKSSRPQSIAVWALRKDKLARTTIVLFESSRCRNEFLRAQRGVFTWDENASYQFISSGRRLSLSEVAVHKHAKDARTIIRKITLNVAHVPKLLKLLFRERVSQHSLMPSYDSAAHAARMYDIWDAADLTPDWQEKVEFRIPQDD